MSVPRSHPELVLSSSAAAAAACGLGELKVGKDYVFLARGELAVSGHSLRAGDAEALMRALKEIGTRDGLGDLLAVLAGRSPGPRGDRGGQLTPLLGQRAELSPVEVGGRLAVGVLHGRRPRNEAAGIITPGFVPAGLGGGGEQG